jgi:hypothetical protein
VYFKWSWGEGNATGWLGPVNSSEPLVLYHTYFKNGNYTITAQVRDALGLEQESMRTYNITIAPQLDLTNSKAGYIYLGDIYFYMPLFSALRWVLKLSKGNGLTLNVTATSHVASVRAAALSVTKGTNYSAVDDNASDGFCLVLPVASDLFHINVTAYDAAGNMIDQYPINLFIYLQTGTAMASRLSLRHRPHLLPKI